MKIDDSLGRLEEITKRLEQDDIPLEEALVLFEEGVSLAAKVNSALDEARLRVKTVLEQAKGSFAIDDFDLQ